MATEANPKPTSNAPALCTRFQSAELGDILGRSAARLRAYWSGFRGIDFTAILEGVARACLSELLPARIVRLEAFPLTAGANASKIQKSKLREMAQMLALSWARKGREAMDVEPGNRGLVSITERN